MFYAVGAAVVLAIGITVGVNAEDDYPRCPADHVILAYPYYTRKGLIEGYSYGCGEPDRTCRLDRYTPLGPLHVCSPFGRQR